MELQHPYVSVYIMREMYHSMYKSHSDRHCGEPAGQVETSWLVQSFSCHIIFPNRPTWSLPRAETSLDTSDAQSLIPFFTATLQLFFSSWRQHETLLNFIKQDVSCECQGENTGCIRAHVLTCSNSRRLCICTGGPLSVSSHEKSVQTEKERCK